jgi:hypothetical protein
MTGNRGSAFGMQTPVPQVDLSVPTLLAVRIESSFLSTSFFLAISRQN